MSMLTDQELLSAAGRGDEGAFALLVERHHRAVIHFIHRFLSTADRATAEDLAQQVLLSAWKYARTFQPRAKVRTWLFKIATNVCLNYRRYERLRSRTPETVYVHRSRYDDGTQGADAPLAEEERACRLRTAIAALPPNQRAAIVLRHFHEFSYAEIAEIIGCSVSAVDSLLHRARRALCEDLGLKKDGNSPQVSAL